MEKKKWKSKIKRACTEAGTYQKTFDQVIDALAIILERRDQIILKCDVGDEPFVIQSNNGSGTMKNPMYVLLNDTEKMALAYWRELGLTPAGLRKINENMIKGKDQKGPENSLMERLNEFKRNRDGGT